MKLRFIQTLDELDAQWPRLQPGLERVEREAARGEFTAADIYRLARESRVAVGMVEDGDTICLAFALEYVNYPQRIALNVMAMGGERFEDAMAQFWDGIKTFAAIGGAEFIEASCSPAMCRVLQRYGFLKIYEVVRCPL